MNGEHVNARRGRQDAELLFFRSAPFQLLISDVRGSFRLIQLYLRSLYLKYGYRECGHAKNSQIVKAIICLPDCMQTIADILDLDWDADGQWADRSCVTMSLLMG
jgi:hypothetical protein